jgi:hypothetical protein
MDNMCAEAEARIVGAGLRVLQLWRTLLVGTRDKFCGGKKRLEPVCGCTLMW